MAQAHGVSYSARYWRILLGPWLLHYVQILYDRYLCLRSALDSEPGLRTTGLSAESYFTPRDFAEMQSVFHTDAFNLQLCTQLGEAMGLPMPERLPHPVRPSQPSRPPLKAALKRLRVSMDPALRIGRGKVWFLNSLLGSRSSARLALKTRGAALPARFLLDQPEAPAPPTLDRPARKTLADLPLLTEDEFSDLLTKTLPANLPWSFLEGYAALRERLRPSLSRAPKALVLDTSLYSGAALFLSAELAERGTRLVCVQHGGSFGMAKRSPMEKHEQQTCDEYWSWGWKEGLAKEAVPMPSLLPAKAKAPPDGSILYAGNSMPRYTYRLWSNPLGPQWARVLDWERRWIKRLEPEAFERLLARPYPIDGYGWGERQRLADEFPRLRLSPPGSDFQGELERASLFVTSTNHTTLLQAFALDKPTVLFWEPALNELRPAAAPFFDALRKAGILHDSPEEAARAVNAVWQNPAAWWAHPRVRPAALAFRERFAASPSDSVEAWSRELLRLAGAAAER